MELAFDILAILSCIGFLVVNFFQLLRILGGKPEKENKDVLA